MKPNPVFVGCDGIVNNKIQLNQTELNPIQLSLAVLGCEQQNPTQLNQTQPNPAQRSCHWLWWDCEQRNPFQLNPTLPSCHWLWWNCEL